VVGLAGLWARVALDLTLTAVTERMDDRKLASHREVKVNERRLALAGVALLSAPLFFVAASLLKYELGMGSCSIRWRLSCPTRKGYGSSTWSHPWFSWAGWVSRWR
jgi:hypothetical protein